MCKISKQDILSWVGADNTVDELVSTLYDLLNGDMSVSDLKDSIVESDLPTHQVIKKKSIDILKHDVSICLFT